jgi:uncharacterized protein YfbU (UPF0304 family)
MAQKSERFEMRVDEDTLERVDKWRMKQGDLPSRAEAMRRLVEVGLARGAGASMSVNFTDGEKLLVMMMRDLYKHLKVRGEIDPEFIGEVIWSGHYWAPRWDMQGLFHDHEDSPDNVRFVVDVLDMWTFLERAHAKLSAKEKARVEKEADPFGKHVQFTGFDGNNESEHMGIARFLIEQMNRFQLFKGRELNSHMPTLGTYRRMLQVFEPMRKTLVGAELSADQIIAILKAKMYPE